MPEKLHYGNWIRKKVLWILAAGTLIFGVLAALPFSPVLRVLAGAGCAILFISFLYPLYSYTMFSPRGGALQEKIYALIVTHLNSGGKGKFLDIGTGNGILAIKLAQNHPASDVIGVDYWGKEWEYSKSVCEENARRANVSERVHYQKGDAASLNFPDATFDAVVSNLTFHEVKLVKRKIDVLREALRVLKPGGRFAFIDYFYEPRYYDEASEFEMKLWSLKLASVEFKPLDEILAYPKLLRHPRALGRVGIVFGQK
jgi:SAM-dependent methyltransferase